MPAQKRSGEVSITHYQAVNFKESGIITGRRRGVFSKKWCVKNCSVSKHSFTTNLTVQNPVIFIKFMYQ